MWLSVVKMHFRNGSSCFELGPRLHPEGDDKLKVFNYVKYLTTSNKRLQISGHYRSNGQTSLYEKPQVLSIQLLDCKRCETELEMITLEKEQELLFLFK